MTDTHTSAPTPIAQMTLDEFVDYVNKLIRDMFAGRKYILGFKASCVLSMTTYGKLVFLRQLNVDQTNETNPREVSRPHLKTIQEILDAVKGYEESYMVEKDHRDKNKPFPYWKAEVARKGLLRALADRLKEMGGFTIETIMQMLDVGLETAKKYAKQLRDGNLAVIKSWNNETPSQTHLFPHRSLA